MKRNKEIVGKFLDACLAQGLSKGRIKKYEYTLATLSKMLNKEFENTDKSDIEALCRKIESSEYADWTKRDFKVTIKKFYKWLEGNSEIYPEKVRWIKAITKNHKKLPEDLLTQDDVKKLIEATTNLRDKALVAVLYESGCRIGELRDIRLKHVEFDKYGTIIRVSGKTGDRRIRLISSTPYISNWIENHPNRNDRDSHLWVSIGTMNHNKHLSYQSFIKLLRVTGEKAGIHKKLNPHAFRHSRATHLANKLTEAQMKEYFGWTQSSEMASTYVHLSGRDVDNAILQIHNIKEPEKQKQDNALSPIVCARCETLNATTAKFCTKCGMALDVQTALEVEHKLNDLAELMNTPEILEKIIERKVEQMLKDKLK